MRHNQHTLKPSQSSPTRLIRRKKQSGQSLAEYGFILALVTVFCLLALQTLGQNMGTMFNGLAGEIQNVATSAP